MHTFEGTVASFHHNPDGSGDVIIGIGNERLVVPCSDVIAFVAELVRSRRIETLESASDVDILGMQALR